MRVLEWMVRRIEGTAQGNDTLFGIVPGYDHLNWQGLDFDEAAYDRITRIEPTAWTRELAMHKEWFEKLGQPIPEALNEVGEELQQRLLTL